MSQHDYEIANQAGAPFRADLNVALAAIQSLNSGGTEPADTVAYMWWPDTTTGLLKQRNAANNAWVTVALLSNFALPSVQRQLATAFTTTGTSTAYLLTPAPAIAANTANTRFRVAFHTAPGATPTLAVSGLTALPLKYRDATGTKQNITSVQVPTNWVSDVETDGTDWMVLDLAPVAGAEILAKLLTVDGASSALDADLLDGQHGSYYATATHNHSGVYVPIDANFGVGCFGICRPSLSTVAAGATVSGSNLRLQLGATTGSWGDAGTPSGAWRNLASTSITVNQVGLFQRYA